MAHITNFVPKLPIFSNLHRMMSCPIFSLSNPLLGPKTHPYPSEYIPRHVFFLVPHPQTGGGVGPYFHTLKQTCKTWQKVRKHSMLGYQIMNVPERYYITSNSSRTSVRYHQLRSTVAIGFIMSTYSCYFSTLTILVLGECLHRQQLWGQSSSAKTRLSNHPYVAVVILPVGGV